MKYALKTADNSGLFLDRGAPIFVEDPEKSDQFWPVDESIPEGYRGGKWLFDKETKTVRREAIPITRDELIARLESRKFIEEAKGIEVGGILFKTDFSSRIRLLEAIAFTQPGEAVIWKDANGERRKLTREELMSLGLKMRELSEQAAEIEEKIALEMAAVSVDASPEELNPFAAKIEEFRPENK